MTRVFAQHVILKEQNQTNWHWTTWNTTTVNERHWLPILFCVQSKTSLTFALLGQMTKKLFSISNFFIFKIKDKHWPILKSQIIFNYCTWILFVKVRSTGNNIPIQSQLWNCSSWHNNTWHNHNCFFDNDPLFCYCYKTIKFPTLTHSWKTLPPRSRRFSSVKRLIDLGRICNWLSRSSRTFKWTNRPKEAGRNSRKQSFKYNSFNPTSCVKPSDNLKHRNR